MNTGDKLELVIVRSFDNYVSANLTLAKLEQSGIHCFLKDEFTVTIDPLLTNAIGGIKIVVHAKEAERALTLLKEFDEEYLQSVKCPKCGAARLVLINKPGVKNIFTAISTWLVSSYAIPGEQVYQCENCLFECKQLPED